MKQLSIGEKAKAYNGLIERLKDLKFAYRFSPLSDTIEEKFPELKESEDERIKEALIEYFRWNVQQILSDFDNKEVLAWLEKQGEQKPVDKVEPSAFKDKLLELFQKFRYIKESMPTNGDIIDYVDAHIHELIDTIQNKSWSEEDKNYYDTIIAILENTKDDAQLSDSQISWLKSLRPQSQWKPSENELEVLRLVAEKDGTCLMGLYENLKKLMEDGYINDDVQLTSRSYQMIKERAPRNAIILAAGFGMRMVPINLSVPKALLEVNGERLIDRQISQLHAVGIKDITVVVGFMKESFEYLIDEFGVDLVVNPDYASSNNIHSLALVADRIHNTYIIPCDIWCDSNPFSNTELYSWYMVSDLIDDEHMVFFFR